jgi:1,4-alpha-glucan branching enzyme
MKLKSWILVSGLLALVPLTAQNTLTFRLDMNGFTGNFTTPEVNGTFNGWCGSCNAMSDPDGDNVWEAVIPNLMFGTIEYKFSYDNWAGQ